MFMQNFNIYQQIIVLGITSVNKRFFLENFVFVAGTLKVTFCPELKRGHFKFNFKTKYDESISFLTIYTAELHHAEHAGQQET